MDNDPKLQPLPATELGRIDVGEDPEKYIREMESAQKLYEQLPETDDCRKMIRPLIDLKDYNLNVVLPFKVSVDTYFKGEMVNFSEFHRTLFAFYATVLRRRYGKVDKMHHLFAAMAECYKRKEDGEEIVTDTDWERFDKKLFFKGLDILCRTKVVAQSVVHNGINLYPIRLFSGEAREYIIYETLIKHCPELLYLARKLRKDIYISDDFNFVVGDWVEEHLDKINFKNPRISQYYDLADNLKLSIIKLS